MTSRLGVAVVLALALAACGGDGDGGSSGATRGPNDAGAADEVALSESSSALADGFLVVAGTSLIGAPVPIGAPGAEDGEVGDDGWIAYLEVHGDPQGVVRDFLGQAEDEGLVPVGTPTEAPFAPDGAPMAAMAYSHCGFVESADYRCQAAAVGPSGSPCFTIDILRNDRSSHARVRFARSSPSYCPPLAGVAADAPSDPPPPPTEWAKVPDEGDQFGEEWGVLSRVSVQEGSRVVAPVIPFSPCEGPVAVLEATGDVGRVLDRYVHAFEEASDLDPELTREVRTSGDRTLDRRIVNEIAGGALVQIDLVTQEDEPAWLYLHGCQG